MNKGVRLAVFIFFGICIVGSGMAGLFSNEETPGERFRKAIQWKVQLCTIRQIEPNNRCFGITGLLSAAPFIIVEGGVARLAATNRLRERV